MQQPPLAERIRPKKISELIGQEHLIGSKGALEGAIKLARRYTGRRKIIGAKNAYHGSTMGALTLMGLEERKKPFEPLIPDVSFIEFNNFDDLSKIDNNTSCVILETIQGGAGFILPKKKLSKENQGSM